MKLTKTILSGALIAVGGLFVAVPLVFEAANYPWRTLAGGDMNGIELPDPHPPEIDYISYDDYEHPAEPPPDTLFAMPDFDAHHDEYEDDAHSETEDGSPPDSGEDVSSTPKPVPEKSKFVLLGSVKIPRINISENLFEGTERQMRYGVGHLEGSPMPGQKGNSVIAAHRVSSAKQPFRYLDKMKNGDIVTVKVGGEVFTYEVFDMFIVGKEEAWVLQYVKEEPYLLTLVTCDPVVSAGARPDRLIVRARLIE